MRAKRYFKKITGFTLIELIMVLLILGILSVVAVSTIPNMGPMRLDMAARKIQSDIRYAQSLAVSTQRWTRIAFSASGDNYSLSVDSLDDGVSEPSGWFTASNPLTKQDYTIQLNSAEFTGIDLSAVNFNGNDELVFDRWGNPYAYSGAGAPADLANPAQVTLTASSGTMNINVERGTGRVSTQ